MIQLRNRDINSGGTIQKHETACIRLHYSVNLGWKTLQYTQYGIAIDNYIIWYVLEMLNLPLYSYISGVLNITARCGHAVFLI